MYRNSVRRKRRERMKKGTILLCGIGKILLYMIGSGLVILWMIITGISLSKIYLVSDDSSLFWLIIKICIGVCTGIIGIITLLVLAFLIFSTITNTILKLKINSN